MIQYPERLRQKDEVSSTDLAPILDLLDALFARAVPQPRKRILNQFMDAVVDLSWMDIGRGEEFLGLRLLDPASLEVIEEEQLRFRLLPRLRQKSGDVMLKGHVRKTVARGCDILSLCRSLECEEFVYNLLWRWFLDMNIAVVRQARHYDGQLPRRGAPQRHAPVDDGARGTAGAKGKQEGEALLYTARADGEPATASSSTSRGQGYSWEARADAAGAAIESASPIGRDAAGLADDQHRALFNQRHRAAPCRLAPAGPTCPEMGRAVPLPVTAVAPRPWKGLGMNFAQ